MTAPISHPRDPLHGITLENILNQLVQRHGWSEMGRRIPIRCFQFNPSVKSSLTFLRKTPWARKRVEDWFSPNYEPAFRPAPVVASSPLRSAATGQRWSSGRVACIQTQRLFLKINLTVMSSFLATTTRVGAMLLMAASVHAQNLFVADWYSFRVYEYTQTGVQSTFASQMYGPVALAFDNSGDLYVGTMDGGGIIKVTPSGDKSTFDSTAATSLAFNGAGNLFASDYSGGNIYEYAPNGTRTTYASGLSAPYGIAFNSAGDLFVADAYGANIIRIKPNGERSTFATGVSGGQDLAFDSAGNLFVASAGTGSIYEYTPAGVQSTFASGLIHPYGLAFDNAGALFVSDNGNGTLDSGMIYEYTLTGERSTFASGFGYGAPAGLAVQPVPEPATWALMAVGAIAWISRQRRHG